MKVLWTATAVAHLAGIHDFIAKSSPVYAQAMVRRLWDRTGQLREFPESGRVVPESRDANVRELLELPYRIMYRVEGGRAEILAIVHARRGGTAIGGEGRAT